MAGFSILFHITVFAAVLFAPQLFRNTARYPDVYTVDLVALPAGSPGPPAGTPQAAPAHPPAPAAARPPAAVKIPVKPEAQVPKAKSPRKPEPPKPKPEKTEAKPHAKESEGADASPATEKGAESSAVGAPGATGAPGGISGQAGGGGGSGFLDDASFAYGWYLSNMTSILGRNWARPIKPDLSTTLRAVVHFRVLKDGNLADIVLEQPSGDSVLDRSALRAVQDSNPLPPLPYQYGKDSLGVHFFFDLKPD
jgi:TonB family protein